MAEASRKLRKIRKEIEKDLVYFVMYGVLNIEVSKIVMMTNWGLCEHCDFMRK